MQEITTIADELWNSFQYVPNKEQQEAILCTEGPLLIIAGPGSGKTMTLVERIVYLIHSGVPAGTILVATFTEKAASELISRVSNRALELGLKINLHEMYIGTLHSIFLRLLEEYREYTRLKRNYRLLDQFDQKYFVYNNIGAYLSLENSDVILGRPQSSNWKKAGQLIGYINKVSEEYLEVGRLLDAEDERIQIIGKAYQVYEKLLEEENALDFSSIQVEMLKLLENEPTVLAAIQEKIRYIMVDEYQDTNTIQERILFLLADKSNNICVVGDDDQGLYRFRGASIRNILEFPQHFPTRNCKRVTLSTNYRSHPDIIRFYNQWMTLQNWKQGGQSYRYEKNIVARPGDFPTVPAVIKVSAEGSQLNYFEEVLAFIKKLETRGDLKDYNQIAFLFRSVKNTQVIDLANYLEEQGIQVFSPRSALFFQREEIRLLIGALVFIFPNLFQTLRWTDDAHMKVWEYYEACKKLFAEVLRSDKEEHGVLISWCQKKAKAHLTLTGKTTYGFTALVYQLLEYPLFGQFLQTNLKDTITDQRPAYNIALFTKLLSKFEYLHQVSVINTQNKDSLLIALFNRFLHFIYEGGIEEYEDFDEYAPSGCVSFMTIHQSKGMEFPIVIVDSLKSVPRKQYSDIDELLQRDFYHKPPFEPLAQTKYFDFWRLYYTAFSRAQNLLVLSANEKLEGHGKCPSKYFKPIYDPLLAWDDPDYDWRLLSLEEVKEVNVKKEYSFTSHILLYENCPLKYKFYKELGFTEVRVGGMMGGTLLHQTIEDIHKAVLRGEEAKVNDENIASWFNTNYHLLVKQQRAYLQPGQLKALLKQVIRYKNKMAQSWHLIREAEVEVSLVKEDYILKGKIDLIQGEGDTVELIDFKTGDKPDVNDPSPYNERALKGFQRQLEIYAHLVEEKTGHTVSKMHLYFPKEELGSPYITFQKDSQKMDRTMATFDGVVEKIELKNYDMNHIMKSEKQCGNCDMRFHCNPTQYA